MLRLREVMNEMMEKSGVNDESLESMGPTQVGVIIIVLGYTYL